MTCAWWLSLWTGKTRPKWKTLSAAVVFRGKYYWAQQAPCSAGKSMPFPAITWSAVMARYCTATAVLPPRRGYHCVPANPSQLPRLAAPEAPLLSIKLQIHPPFKGPGPGFQTAPQSPGRTQGRILNPGLQIHRRPLNKGLSVVILADQIRGRQLDNAQQFRPAVIKALARIFCTPFRVTVYP